MNRRSILTLLLAAVAVPAAARAQVAVYAMGSAGRLSNYTSTTPTYTITAPSSAFWAYGVTFGAYDTFAHLGPVTLGGDIRGFIQSSGDHNTLDTQITNHMRGFLAGFRLAGATRVLPLKPYLQAEVGAVSTNLAISTAAGTGYAYQIQAGADFTIMPHLDFRAEYGAGQFREGLNGGTTTAGLQQLGGGLVVRF